MRLIRNRFKVAQMKCELDGAQLDKGKYSTKNNKRQHFFFFFAFQKEIACDFETMLSTFHRYARLTVYT